jgi:hypothetical protein
MVVPTLYLRKRFKQIYTLNLDLKELVLPFRFIYPRKDCRHTRRLQEDQFSC